MQGKFCLLLINSLRNKIDEKRLEEVCLLVLYKTKTKIKTIIRHLSAYSIHI
jgi:hypothetical protein